MTIYKKDTLADGSAVVHDNTDDSEWILKPGQWEQEVVVLPHDDQRQKVLELVKANEIPSSDDPAFTESQAGKDFEAGQLTENLDGGDKGQQPDRT